MFLPRFLFLLSLISTVTLFAAAEPEAIVCEGSYPQHLQGICRDESGAIFWSWTDALVKTDARGKLLEKVAVATHHGDLCFHDGKVFVAVNLGKFNEPPGKADSWIYVYDAGDLRELARHPVPEVVHGAGGMAWHAGHFIVVGGLPDGVDENYLYQYDERLNFERKITLASGHTMKGIQTAVFAGGAWWFGCYGNPPMLLKADEEFRFAAKWPFNASIGIESLPDGTVLLARQEKKAAGWTARLVQGRIHHSEGIKILDVK